MSRPRRLDADQYRGHHQYFLTICTFRRSREFADADTVALVRLQFLRTAHAEQCELLAYCFMPDHVHLLVTAQSETTNLPRFVRLAKQRSGFLFRQARGRRLWQDSYFDRTLRDGEEPARIVKYMIENPLRAGLVESPAAYPHWGSQRYSREEILEFVAYECRV